MSSLYGDGDDCQKYNYDDGDDDNDHGNYNDDDGLEESISTCATLLMMMLIMMVAIKIGMVTMGVISTFRTCASTSSTFMR